MRALSACICSLSVKLTEKVLALGQAMCIRSFCLLGTLKGAPWACVSLQEAEHESGRLEISPILWAGVTSCPNSYPGNTWRRTRLQHSAGGGSVEALHSAHVHQLQDSVMLCRKQRPARLQTEQDSFLQSIGTLLQPVSEMRDRQSGSRETHISLERFDYNQEALNMFIVDNTHRSRALGRLIPAFFFFF